MLEFLARRLAAALITLALASVVIFVVLEVLPGDPAEVMLGTEARPDTLKALRAKFGFDRPPLERFGKMLWDYLRFDFGESYFRDISVLDLIIEKMPV
jgi:peptide/nickel transport system permease protein